MELIRHIPNAMFDYPIVESFLASDNIINSGKLTEKAQLSGCKILFVDEEYVNYLYYSELLKETGIDLFRAFSLPQIYYWLSTEKDISMLMISSSFLEIAGYEKISQIKQLYPALFVTVLIDDFNTDIISRSTDSGCDLHLNMRMDSVHLIETLLESLGLDY